MRRLLARSLRIRALAIVLVTLLTAGLVALSLVRVGRWEYNRRGRTAFNKGLYDEAISNYTKAIKLSPHYARAYYNRALAYFKKDKFDIAISDYSKAIELKPTDYMGYDARGTVYERMGHDEEAIRDYNRAIQLNSTFPDSYLGRGNSEKHKG